MQNKNLKITTGANICPLNEKCLTKSILYRAEIKSDKDTVAYIGLASYTFKGT